MTRSEPRPGCFDLAFHGSYPMDETADVALEDYARTVFRCAAAEALRARELGGGVTGVHVCGLAVSPAPPALTDVEDFARDLAVRSGGGGLGWN